MTAELKPGVTSDPTIPTTTEAKSEMSTPPPLLPLDVGVRRLERLLLRDCAPTLSVNGDSPADSPHGGGARAVRRFLSHPAAAAARAHADAIGANVVAECLARLLPGRLGAGLVREFSGDGSDDMELDATTSGRPISPIAAQEAEAYLLGLAVHALWRSGDYTAALALSGTALRHVSLALGTDVRAGHALSPLLGRLYRYRSLAATGLASSEKLRSEHAVAHRMACLRNDVDCQATLLNLMLQDLLMHNLVEEAQKLMTNATFPESASNNQLCRYLYYCGRIQSLQLEYTDAFSKLSQSLRKAPTNTGLGFRITVQRLLVVVQLLMGEIPERSVFFQPGMRTALDPYLQIAHAVRVGDLHVFEEAVASNTDGLRSDGTYTLISRLAHSVVKAGLRRLAVSYSRIGLDDIASRLSLDSASSAEFVCAKAIRDGVIDASIDHAGKFLKSHELVDVYATTEPQEAFHRRITYCLNTHNEAVRAMRYPPDAARAMLEASRGNSASDEKTDEEKAQELEDELDDDY